MTKKIGFLLIAYLLTGFLAGAYYERWYLRNDSIKARFMDSVSNQQLRDWQQAAEGKRPCNQTSTGANSPNVNGNDGNVTITLESDR